MLLNLYLCLTAKGAKNAKMNLSFFALSASLRFIIKKQRCLMIEKECVVE